MVKWLLILFVLCCAVGTNAQVTPPPNPIANLPLLTQAQNDFMANLLSYKGWVESQIAPGGTLDVTVNTVGGLVASKAQQDLVNSDIGKRLTQAENDVAALKTAFANLSSAQPMPAPVIGNSVAATASSITFAVNKGQAIWVSCNYAPGNGVPVLSDAQGDAFSLLGGGTLPSGSGAASTWVALNVTGGATTISSAAPCKQMYAVAVSNVVNLDSFAPASGPASPATGTLTTHTANELVIVFVETGAATNALNWTQITNFSGNLVSSQIVSAPTSVIPSFVTNNQWVMTMTAFRSQ